MSAKTSEYISYAVAFMGYEIVINGRFRVVVFSPNCCCGPVFGPIGRLQFEPNSNPRSALAYLTAAAVRTETDHPNTPIVCAATTVFKAMKP